MKPGVHPAYKSLRIKIGEDIFETNSTLSAGELLMDVDYRKHPAWTRDGLSVVNESNQTISSFNKKFAGLRFGVK